VISEDSKTSASHDLLLPSQIGQDCHLGRHGMAQVERAMALSVVVPWIPVGTAVNGMVAARPARTTVAGPRSVGVRSTAG
jgi:hypothetical protein